jgi:hypothetical protein
MSQGIPQYNNKIILKINTERIFKSISMKYCLKKIPEQSFLKNEGTNSLFEIR